MKILKQKFFFNFSYFCRRFIFFYILICIAFLLSGVIWYLGSILISFIVLSEPVSYRSLSLGAYVGVILPTIGLALYDTYEYNKIKTPPTRGREFTEEELNMNEAERMDAYINEQTQNRRKNKQFGEDI